MSSKRRVVNLVSLLFLVGSNFSLQSILQNRPKVAIMIIG